MNNNAPPGTSISSSAVKFASSKFLWTIQDFNEVLKVSNQIRSAKFTLRPGYDDCEFCFTLDTIELKEHWTVKIGTKTTKSCWVFRSSEWNEHLERNHLLIQNSCVQYIIGSDGQRMLKKKRKKLRFGESIYQFDVSKNDLIENCRGIMVNGCIQFRTELTFVTTRNTMAILSEDEENMTQSPYDIRNIVDQNHLAALSDFEIEVEGQRLKVHKLVLAMRSPIFAAMFSADMKESRENLLNLGHIDTSVVKIFVDYMYTNKLDQNASRDLATIVELMKLAEQYQIICLRIECVNRLIGMLSIDNTIDILKLGDMYNSEILCEAAMKFVQTNRLAFADKDYLRKLLMDEPNLAENIIKILTDEPVSNTK